VTKLALSVFVAVWIRESGLGPPTHVRTNSKPAASRAPPKALTSQARIGQVRLVTLHTQTSLTDWNPSPAGLESYVYGHLSHVLHVNPHPGQKKSGKFKNQMIVRAT